MVPIPILKTLITKIFIFWTTMNFIVIQKIFHQWLVKKNFTKLNKSQIHNAVPRGYYFTFFRNIWWKNWILLNPRINPLTAQIQFVFNNFFWSPLSTIIQIKITLFYFRYFIEDLTCCKVFSLNVFIDFTTWL